MNSNNSQFGDEIRPQPMSSESGRSSANGLETISFGGNSSAKNTGGPLFDGMGSMGGFGSFDGNGSSAGSGHSTMDFQNSYANQSYQRQRQMTLGDLLLENRIVFLQGEIHTGNANELVMKLLYLQSENRKKDIHFYINSPGGDVIATLAIYDTMQILSCPVATYCVGHAMSGAAILLAGGSKGKRSALPNSRIMVHQPHGGVGGQVSDIEIQAKEILRYRDLLNEILAKHTGKTAEEIAKDMDRDFFLGATEARDYGLVDRVTEKAVVEAEDEGIEL